MREIIWFFQDIYFGWASYLSYLLGRKTQEEIKVYEQKKSVCNKDCPLYSTIMGAGVCDPLKEHKGKWGCGCVLVAKRWGDSECPLGKF